MDGLRGKGREQGREGWQKFLRVSENTGKMPKKI